MTDPVDIADLIDPTGHTPASTTAATTVASQPADEVPVDTSLIASAERITDRFETALAERDGDAATRAALELETTMAAWAADPTMSDEADRARALLRSMISRLGGAASTGLGDPRDIVAPLVSALLDLRATARAERRFDLADLVRDRMTQAGIEVRDTPDGAEWDLV